MEKDGYQLWYFRTPKNVKINVGFGVSEALLGKRLGPCYLKCSLGLSQTL